MSESKKTLIVVGLAVVAAIILILFRPQPSAPVAPSELEALAQLDEPVELAEPEPEPVAPVVPVDAGLVVAPPEPEPEPEPDKPPPPDIFAGEAPELITRNHIKIIDGQRVSYTETKKLYEYGVEHQDDARPQLLLAWDAMQRQWDGMATRLYVKAYKADPRVKELPRTLHDMVTIAMRYDKVEGREATDAIETIYGTEAIEVIDEYTADAAAGRRQHHVKRLEKLKDRLLGR